MFTIIDTPFTGLKIIEPFVHGDERGYFFEVWKKSFFEDAGLSCSFVQDNESRSTFGVVRGLHWQAAPYAQTKLLRAVAGTILDVVVDLRQTEATFGKHFVAELSGENHRQFYIPKGFAHGFAVLSKCAVVNYKVDAPWVREAERCLRFDDPALGIDLPIPVADRILSPKDSQGMSWKELLEKQEGFH
ncbi:MAG: dTDP-4-dehydrorhamnose 3,5-epimerase [Victivallales bacterium]|nr:dTDP-4-dehydrorhamnose 3,5-epimerase [Victivallales bacterium]